MSGPLISISGNIATGKTSLCKALSARLGWSADLEAPADNPYFATFYEDMGQWALQSQLAFLARHVGSQALFSYDAVVQDRCIYEDAHIFAQLLHEGGKISNADWQLYRVFADHLIRTGRKPKLMLYLVGEPTELLRRIRERGERAEAYVTLEYLERLDFAYGQWIEGFSICPVIRLDAGDLERMFDERSLDGLAGEIRRHAATGDGGE